MTQLEVLQDVITVENSTPLVRKTTTRVEPAVKGETPQKVFEKKKTIFRFNQIIWYILGFIEVLLIFRFVLKALGANPFSGFASLIYSATEPLTAPFRGILNVATTGTSVIEWSTIIAAVVYLSIAWGIVYLLDLVYPITPEDVEIQK